MSKHMDGRNVAAPVRTMAQAIARALLNTRADEHERFEYLNGMIERWAIPRYQVLWAMFEA